MRKESVSRVSGYIWGCICYRYSNVCDGFSERLKLVATNWFLYKVAAGSLYGKILFLNKTFFHHLGNFLWKICSSLIFDPFFIFIFLLLLLLLFSIILFNLILLIQIYFYSKWIYCRWKFLVRKQQLTKKKIRGENQVP